MFYHSLRKLGWPYSTLKSTANFDYIQVLNTKWSYQMDGSYPQSFHCLFCGQFPKPRPRECHQLWYTHCFTKAVAIRGGQATAGRKTTLLTQYTTCNVVGKSVLRRLWTLSWFVASININNLLHDMCLEKVFDSNIFQKSRRQQYMNKSYKSWATNRSCTYFIYNARGNRGCPPTSPNNTAPATKNDSHDWSSSHMKRHLQCAE